MGAIDIGADSQDRNNDTTYGYTYICTTNPANDTGKLSTVAFYVAAAFNNGLRVGTLSGSGASWTARSYADLGNFGTGSQSVSGLSINVSANDIIGIYAVTSGRLDEATPGTGDLRWAGDAWATGGAQTYEVLVASLYMSCYGTGTTGWANIAKVNGIASADMVKFNGKAWADIAKIKGVAV